MTDTEILDWLDDYMSYRDMVEIFGDVGIGDDGGPRSLRATVEDLNEKQRPPLNP